MNGRHMITASVIVALTLAVTVCASCGNGGGTAASKPAASERGAEGSNGIVRIGPDAQRTIGLQTATVREGTVAGEITTTAVIKPNDYRLVHVSPRIPGKAISVQAQLGDLVKPGQVLAELDSIELGQRKADYLRAKANLDVDRRNYERERKLYKQQISSEKEFLDAKGAFERSEANYQSARETLKLVGLSDREIDSLTWNPVGGHPLSHFPLTAPLSGTVIERHITVGELIQPDETVFTLADLSDVWVLVDVYEKDLGKVGMGDRVQVSVDAYPGQVFEGKVDYISNIVDSKSRTAPTRVAVPNPEGRLRPGLFATVRLSLRTAARAGSLVVPASAVQRVNDKPAVFIEQKPGVFAIRYVSLGNVTDREAEVLSGLRSGERVVSAGSFYLKSSLLKEEIGGGD
jgi:cobalt-zinc-cadmium efflux system membrane fusion protein